MAALYTYEFCRNLIYSGNDMGVIDNLEDAIYKMNKNFADMDLENAIVQEEIEFIVSEMLTELQTLIREIESIYFL